MKTLNMGKIKFIGFDGMSEAQLKKLSKQVVEGVAPQITKLKKPVKKTKKKK